MWIARHWRVCLVALGLGALLFLAVPASAQSRIYGRVTDTAGNPLAGVILTARGDSAPAATPSNAVGDYELRDLRPARYRVSAERAGYATVFSDVTLDPGEQLRLDFSLRPDTVVLEGVVVEGRDQERTSFENEAGVTVRIVTGEALKTLPGLAEADVLRAVEVLPGVISTSDFSSAFHVRGGSADQNLILLDGFTVFNPFHLGGLFSVFNSDAIARAELLAGGFGAEYGGRVSSVLTVETDAGSGSEFEFDGGVSLLATRLLVRGPLPRALSPGATEPGRWMLSARRSYFDQILRPVFDFPYHLTDLQAFVDLPVTAGGRLSLTGYLGDDVLDLSDFEPPDENEDSSSVLRLRWKWGNHVLGARWRQTLGDSWLADTHLGYSAFSDQLGFDDFDGIRFSGEVGQLSLRTELGRELGDRGSILIGGSADRIRFRNSAQAGGTEFFDSSDRGVLAAAFASLRFRPNDRWIVEPGFRVDVWAGRDVTHETLAPRLAIKRFFGRSRSFAAKLAVGRYTQFLHSLRNEEFPVSNDTWVLAGAGTPVVVSDQLQVGVEKYWGDTWYASVEAYARDFDGVTEINFADDPNDPDDDLNSGRGRSRGLDLFARRSTGRITGWAALSLLEAERTFPDVMAATFEDLPDEVSYPPIFDRHVDLDLVLRYELPRNWELGGRWNYGSPIPYTRPISQYFGFRYSPLRGRYEPLDPGDDDPSLYVALGERNRERYPPYHRLDLTVRRTFEQSWGSWTPYLQVLNLYDRRNVLFYFYNYDRLPPTRSGVSMFPVLPFLGLEFSF